MSSRKGGLDDVRGVIRKAFDMVDTNGTGSIHPMDVPHLIRALGQYPAEEVLKNIIIPQMTTDGIILYDSFEKFILKCMVDHTYDRDDSVTLRNAFRVFDQKESGAVLYDDVKDCELVALDGDDAAKKLSYLNYIADMCTMEDF